MYTANTFIRSISILLLGILCLSIFTGSTHAVAEQPTWLDTTQHPTLRAENTISNAEHNTLRQQQQGYARQECIQKKVTIRLIPLTYHDGCWYTTTIGMLEKDGKYLLEPGSKVAGHLKNNTNNTSKLRPTLNPNVFVETISDQATGYGHFLSFRNLSMLKFHRDTSSNSGSINLSTRLVACDSRAQLVRCTSRAHIYGTRITQSGWLFYSKVGVWLR